MKDMQKASENQSNNVEEDENSERDRRARVFKKGKMVFANGLRSIPCIVRNISEGGAQIETEQAHLIPKQFELHIELEDYDVSCERRWQEGLRLGVQFVGEKRPRSQQRAQVLQSSEGALKTEDLEIPGFFGRRDERDVRRPVDPSKPLSRPRPGGGKPSFGKRRG